MVVGSAITRPEHITQWFADAIAGESAPARPVLAIDIGGSKTAVALVLENRVLERRQVPTQPADGAEVWLRASRRCRTGLAWAVWRCRGRRDRSDPGRTLDGRQSDDPARSGRTSRSYHAWPITSAVPFWP